ncbi:MAG: 3-hydroxyisobutyrate dehydrogenase [Alphaproteobacteria bacterium]|nr:MAG: 3-hydroxyisobutyrate dehydrogenase [Alphaproteobacteria bacterium]
MKDTTTGIIGVGLMGHGIAASLQRKGWLIGFLDHPGNQPTDDLVAAGAWVAATPAALAGRCETIILCVTGSPQVEAVLAGTDGILERMQAGTVVIDCSTAVPESTRRMAALVEKAGGAMLDAPMTRTPKEAAQGRLNLIVGGDRAVFEARRPLLEAFAENITYAGASGSGHTLKLLHNFVSLGFAAVLGEAAAAAGRGGIDPAVLQAVLAKGGGGGVALDRMSPYILERDPSGLRFTLANAAKDLDYYCAMADHLGAAAAIARAIRDTYQGTVDSGEASRLVPELIDLLG